MKLAVRKIEALVRDISPVFKLLALGKVCQVLGKIYLIAYYATGKNTLKSMQ
jgi:hypothetical protein